MGNVNSPQRGGANFLHDPLLASPSSAAAATAAAGGETGPYAATSEGGQQHAVGGPPGEVNRQQHQHPQYRAHKAAATASPGPAAAGGTASAQVGCSLMLGGEDSMSAWLDSAARQPQEASGAHGEPQHHHHHEHSGADGPPGGRGGESGGGGESMPTPAGAVRPVHTGGPVTTSPTTASPGGTLVMDWGDLTAAAAVVGAGTSPLRSPSAISGAAAAADVSLGVGSRGPAAGGAGHPEAATVVSTTAGPAAAAAAAMLSLSPESLPPPPQEHQNRMAVSPTAAAAAAGAGVGGGMSSTIGGFGNISITLKKAGGAGGGRGGAGGGKKRSAAAGAAARAIAASAAVAAAAVAGTGGAGAVAGGKEQEWDASSEMLNYAAALAVAAGEVPGAFDDEGVGVVEDDDDYVREEVDSSSEDEIGGGGGEEEEEMDQEMETLLLRVGGQEHTHIRRGAGGGKKKDLFETVSKRGRHRRPSAKAAAAAGVEKEEEEEEEEKDEQQSGVKAEALLPLPFHHGANGGDGGASSGGASRGASKRGRGAGGVLSESDAGSNRKSSKMAGMPAQLSRTTSVQLASLMPTPSSSLVLQLNPPTLLLEQVSFQTIFGQTLQKELDHYLTYGRNVSAQYWADTLRKEMARAVWMVQALGAPHNPLHCLEDLARVLSTGRSVVTQLYRMGKGDVFPGTAPCSEASILRRRAALNILLEAVGLKAEKMPPRKKEGRAGEGKENLGLKGLGLKGADDGGCSLALDDSGLALMPTASDGKKGKARGRATALLPTQPSSSSSAVADSGGGGGGGMDAPLSYKRRNSTKGGKIHKTPLARDMERKLEAFLIREHHLTLASAANYLSHVRTMLREALERIGDDRRALSGNEAALALHSPALARTEYVEDRPSYWSAFVKFLKQEHGLRTVGCGLGLSATAAPTPAPASGAADSTHGLSPLPFVPLVPASSAKRPPNSGVKRARLSMNEPLVMTEEHPPAAGGATHGRRKAKTKSLSSGHFQLVATTGGGSSSKARRGEEAAASAACASSTDQEVDEATRMATAAVAGGEKGMSEADGLMPKPVPIRLSIKDAARPTLKFVTPSPQTAPSAGSQRQVRMMKL